MLNRLRTYIQTGFKRYGLEVFQRDGSLRYHLTEFTDVKGELEITNSVTHESWEALLATLKGGIPIALVYNASTVITKFSKDDSEAYSKAEINRLLPNFDFDKFYFELTAFANYKMLSVVQKEELSAFLKKCQGSKFNIYSIGLGPAPLSLLYDLHPLPVYHTNSHAIHIPKVASDLPRIEDNTDSAGSAYEIQGMRVAPPDLLPLAAVLSDFLTHRNYFANITEITRGLQKDFRATRQFNLLLQSFLVFLLVVLGLNFYYFNNYYTQTEKLKNTIATQDGLRENYLKLQERVLQKEKRLQALQTNVSSDATYVFDQIGQSIPESILLTKMTYHPMQGSIQKGKPINYQQSTLLIEGIVGDDAAFNNWVLALQEIDRFSGVTTIGFGLNDRNTSVFKLDIELSNEADKSP